MSSFTNRLAGLPKIPKIKKKTAPSPPKPKAAPLPFPVNPSDEDTLSEPSSSSLSSDSDSSNVKAGSKPSSTTHKDKKGKGIVDVCLVCEGACRCGGAKGNSVRVPQHPSSTSKPKPLGRPPGSSTTTKPKQSKSSNHSKPTAALPTLPLAGGLPALPPLPPLPPLPAFPVASTSSSRHGPSVASTSSSTTPKPRPKPSKPTPTASASSRPKPASVPPVDPSYSPSASVPRSAAPQRMSLRQVLALSLQEAEEQKSRENTPDASEISNAARGSRGKGKDRLSDVSDFALEEDSGKREGKRAKAGYASDSSLSSSLSSDSSGTESSDEDAMDVDENEVGGMEREEEKLLRAEMERREGKGKAVARFNMANSDDAAELEEEDLGEAWEKNAAAMEKIRRRRSSGLDTSFDKDDSDDDSDVAITEVPPGNGFGVVTWSDYDSFGSDDEASEEDQLAEVLEAREAGLAGEFEDELEELFALSEAVVGPIQHDKYDVGDMWLEALSDGSTADDEDEEGMSDVDAEMIFGADGELTRLFGRRRKRRLSAVDSSAGDTDSGDEDATDFDEDDELEHARAGLADADEDDDGNATASYHTEDEQTDSSCSDTDIYRYAPRTGALANLQAPTTADLASLTVEPAASESTKGRSSSFNPKPPFARAARSTSSSTTTGSQARSKADLPTFKRRLPKMGTFDMSERKKTAGPTELSVVVVKAGDEVAPSPFRVPSKKTKQSAPLPPTPSRRTRADSRVSTTSGTSGSMSLDPGSNVGSPVLGNVVLPDFDLDSLLQESVFQATDSEEQDLLDALLVGGSSSETDGGMTTDAANPTPSTSTSIPTITTTKPPSAIADFSRWNRIPIGAFRSRTMGMGNGGHTAPSQVLTAQAAASERSKKRRKVSSSDGSKRGGDPGVASSILRDHKAVKASLRHTLGSPGAAMQASRKAIRSRMLTSPVLGPVIPSPARRDEGPSSASTSSKANLAAVAAAVFSKKHKKKKSRKTRSLSSAAGTLSRAESRQASIAPSISTSTSSANLASSTLVAAPTANLPPLHSPLFSKLDLPMQ
ncbi:hypothetical protein JCM10212_002400 [Sporobolomyces blumeae]